MNAGFDDEELLDITVSGDVIRFMWDYTVAVPLWDREGLLPEEPTWLRQVLGLSEPLIRDLSSWGRAMNHLDENPSLRTEEAYRDLDQRARTLVDRLRREVGSRYVVKYKPW
ncbi:MULTISPECIES: hypothetical protein [unclassified Nocardioides]|uniref:hypothetical protein n=1 Tax=unclassified Nocardioides TaxID=2615069 RepID=UPI003616A3FA